MSKSLVLTVIGKDRPGIVNRLSDVAQRFGANWAGSRMAGLAGQFAGIVHFQVPDEKLEPLAAALRAPRASADLVVVIAEGDAGAVAARRSGSSGSSSSATTAPASCATSPAASRKRGREHRGAAHGVRERADVRRPAVQGERAARRAGRAAPMRALKRELEALATEMMVDFELEPHGDRDEPIYGCEADELAQNENGAARAPFVIRSVESSADQAEKDEPQPQVVVAFGFLMTNCAPSRPSW